MISCSHSKPIISELNPMLKPVSGLTKAFAVHAAKLLEVGSEKGKINLTIYLPDCSPLKVSAKDTSDFKELISIILATHKEKNVSPALDYKNPANYELRIHEGLWVVCVWCVIFV